MKSSRSCNLIKTSIFILTLGLGLISYTTSVANLESAQKDVRSEMDKDQLRELIRTVLIESDLYSEDAVELLMLTAAVESKLGYYIKQIKGPARGIFQMEPATSQDIDENYLAYKPHLKNKLNKFSVGRDDELDWNLAYQIVKARLHYLRKPDSLPPHHDVHAMARYWKDHYNTYQGAGTIQKAVDAYNKYCL